MAQGLDTHLPVDEPVQPPDDLAAARRAAQSLLAPRGKLLEIGGQCGRIRRGRDQLAVSLPGDGQDCADEIAGFTARAG